MRIYGTCTDEKDLLIRLRQGDERAFEQIYDVYKRRLAGNILRIVKSEELAADLLQDLFLKIWHKREDIDPDQPFPAYLYRIARNLVTDIFRKARRDERLKTQLLATASEFRSYIEEDIFREETSKQLHDAINLLPPQRKRVYTLCKIEGKSYKEASAYLGISCATVNEHIKKANRFLKQHFQPSTALWVAVFSELMLNKI